MTLISLVLSSQTENDRRSCGQSPHRFSGKLSLEALLAAEEQVIADAISKVGFWRRETVHPQATLSSSAEMRTTKKNVKSRYIRQAAHRLRDRFDSDVPKNVNKLARFPARYGSLRTPLQRNREPVGAVPRSLLVRSTSQACRLALGHSILAASRHFLSHTKTSFSMLAGGIRKDAH